MQETQTRIQAALVDVAARLTAKDRFPIIKRSASPFGLVVDPMGRAWLGGGYVAAVIDRCERVTSRVLSADRTRDNQLLAHITGLHHGIEQRRFRVTGEAVAMLARRKGRPFTVVSVRTLLLRQLQAAYGVLEHRSEPLAYGERAYLATGTPYWIRVMPQGDDSFRAQTNDPTWSEVLDSDLGPQGTVEGAQGDLDALAELYSLEPAR